jgi:site-specific DNA-methyltransferase (adenine-specific)
MYVFSKGKPKTVNLISDKKNIHSGYRIRKTCGRNPDGSYQRSSGSKKKKTVKEFGVRTNIWKINSGLGTSDRIAHKHPAIFPEQLAEDHIISWSNEKDIVLDPFMGSGTTAVSAIRLKRNYIGFDVSEEYCEIAERRILDITCQ